MMQILKNLITILVCVVVVIEGIDYNSLKYNSLNITEPKTYTQETSTTYFGMLKVKESLKLEFKDLLHCEVTNPHLNLKKPRMIIHTMGSTISEPSLVTKFSNPTDKNCFSFSVKASGIAYIYLYTDLSIFTYKTVALGFKNNTKSLISDNDRICKACKPVSTMDILNPLEFRAFWISWDDNTIEVGKEGENVTFLSKTYYEGIGKIQYIGIATTKFLGHSTWKIEEPYCPNVLNAPDMERTVLTRCNKIFDQNDQNLKKYSDGIQILQKVQALEVEYLVEKLETQMNLTRLKDYYYKNTEELYKIYLKLIKYCKSKCNEEVLNTIKTTIKNLRKMLKDKIEDLMSKPQCSINGVFYTFFEKCICNDGYAGNGIFCEFDSDLDGIPDENIPECVDRPECRKDNCPYIQNQYQEDSDKDGVGDLCQPKSIHKIEDSDAIYNPNTDIENIRNAIDDVEIDDELTHLGPNFFSTISYIFK